MAYCHNSYKMARIDNSREIAMGEHVDSKEMAKR